eukprot:15446966-Alexandrium_andersonii.AAC.1
MDTHIEYGLLPVPEEPTLFYKASEDLAVLAHMDDLNAGGPEPSLASYFAFVKSRFLLKVGGYEHTGSSS